VLALASSQSWLPLLRPSILLAAAYARNVWMETGLNSKTNDHKVFKLGVGTDLGIYWK